MSTGLPHTTSPAAPGEATEPAPFRLSHTSREIRLGLVVYGGVSLAIYINGVTHELFRAVRGRGVYRLLKRLLDLFVTGTDFDGRMTTTVDATGRQIEIKSHRTIFHLKHRKGRKVPFQVAAPASSDHDRATISALAQLAAITSCFPAAFEPVRVAPSRDQHQNAVYELLEEWGQLEGETWFIDGGVLDNKPFSYTIQQIWNRTATRPVERKLFYVEPDPERLDPARRRSPAQVPSVVQAAMDALLGIPGYESIAEDLEHIVRRNDKLQRQVRVRVEAFLRRGAVVDAAVAARPRSDADRARGLPRELADHQHCHRALGPAASERCRSGSGALGGPPGARVLAAVLARPVAGAAWLDRIGRLAQEHALVPRGPPQLGRVRFRTSVPERCWAPRTLVTEQDTMA
jgi:hypothetical protein